LFKEREAMLFTNSRIERAKRKAGKDIFLDRKMCDFHVSLPASRA